MYHFSLRSVIAAEWPFSLGFKTDWDLHVYVHNPGDELWFVYIGFNVDIAYFKLDVNNMEGLRTSDITVKSVENHFRNKPTAPCKSYDKVI